MGVVQSTSFRGYKVRVDSFRTPRRPSGAEAGEAACRGRCGGGSPSPAKKEGVVRNRVSPGFEPRRMMETSRFPEGPSSRELRQSGRRLSGLPLIVLAFVAALLLPGCNAGLAALLALLLIGDRDDRPFPLPAVVDTFVSFEQAQNARARPSETLISFRLENAARQESELQIEFAPEGAEFRPATLFDAGSGSISAPGMLSGLATSAEGVIHQVGWNAELDLGSDDLHHVMLRLTATGNSVTELLEVGNDPPRLISVEYTPLGGGAMAVDVVIADSSGDPTDLLLEASAIILKPSLEDFLPTTTSGPTMGLETSAKGVPHRFIWHSDIDLGRIDRTVTARLTPADRVEDLPGKTGESVDELLELDNNAAPEAELLEGELLRNPDQRRGIAVPFILRDAESDPVDALVQWSVPGLAFPPLPSEIDRDPAARELLLQDAGERRRLRLITLDPQLIGGVVERPAAALALEENEVLATWVRHAAEARGLEGAAAFEGAGPSGPLAGRRAVLVRAGGEREARRICSYDPASGVLRLAAAFEPPAAPGDLLEIDLGEMIELRSSPEGVRHRLVWASGEDLPGGGPVRLRITPYDRVLAAAPELAGHCEVEGEFPLENTLAGDIGTPSASAEVKELAGPFGLPPPVLLPLGAIDEPAAIAAADIDGDGRLDVVVAARSSQALLVFFQNVPGSFDLLRLPDARLGQPTAMLVADLDGDGKLDAAVAAEEPGGVLLFLQRSGVDLISSRVLLTAGGSLGRPTALAAGDLDRDGDVDLVVFDDADGGGFWLFFRGGAAGTAGCIAPERSYLPCPLGLPAAPGLGRVLDLLIADVDGDSRNDIACAREGGFSVLFQDASGAFGGRVTHVPVAGALLSSVSLETLADGRELLFADRALGRLVSARLPGLELSVVAPLSPVPLGRPLHAVAADLDRDGRPDLVVADADAGRLAICLATPGSASSCHLLARTGPGGAVRSSPRRVTLGDIDGDGLVDILSAELDPPQVAIIPQDGAGRFSEPAAVILEEELPGGPRGLAAADLDGNGRIDIAAVSAFGGDLSLAFQEERDAFSIRRLEPGALIPAPAGAGEGAGAPSDNTPIGVAAGDIDGDGRVDLATADIDSNRVIVLFQDAGGFTARLAALSDARLRGPQAVALGDIDGDGRLDVVTAGRFSNTVLWFRQSGAGGFAAGVPLPEGSSPGTRLAQPIALLVSDIDGDGRLDVAVVGHSSDNLVFFLHGAERGSFTVSSGATFASGTAPLAVKPLGADFVVAGLGGPRLVHLERTGPAAFAQRAFTAPLEGVVPAALAAGDLDGSGRLDVVLASAAQFDPALLVFLAPGGEKALSAAPPRFLRSPLLGAPVDVLALDLDGDGELDLVAANRSSRRVTVFRGGR
jgi:hypothetical protein